MSTLTETVADAPDRAGMWTAVNKRNPDGVRSRVPVRLTCNGNLKACFHRGMKPRWYSMWYVLRQGWHDWRMLSQNNPAQRRETNP